MPHLSGLAEDYAKKGLNVIALTNESRDTVLKFLEQKNVTPVSYTIGYGGGAQAYPTADGIPQAFLVGADGRVVWQGHPSECNGKMIEAELKNVKLDQTRAVRAEKALAYAEALLAKKDVLRALCVLEKAAKDAKAGDAAKKAADRIASVNADEALKKELDAQKQLDKAVGGLDLPKEKLKDKERDAKAKQIDALAKKFKDTAPATAAMAEAWAKDVREDWKAEK